jgi:hypothetical protein
MRERAIIDQRTGLPWNMILHHPKGDEAVLVLQPPEGFNVKDFPPEFEASAVRQFLADADQP